MTHALGASRGSLDCRWGTDPMRPPPSNPPSVLFIEACLENTFDPKMGDRRSSCFWCKGVGRRTRPCVRFEWVHSCSFSWPSACVCLGQVGDRACSHHANCHVECVALLLVQRRLACCFACLNRLPRRDVSILQKPVVHTLFYVCRQFTEHH